MIEARKYKDSIMFGLSEGGMIILLILLVGGLWFVKRREKGKRQGRGGEPEGIFYLGSSDGDGGGD